MDRTIENVRNMRRVLRGFVGLQCGDNDCHRSDFGATTAISAVVTVAPYFPTVDLTITKGEDYTLLKIECQHVLDNGVTTFSFLSSGAAIFFGGRSHLPTTVISTPKLIFNFIRRQCRLVQRTAPLVLVLENIPNPD